MGKVFEDLVTGISSITTDWNSRLRGGKFLHRADWVRSCLVSSFEDSRCMRTCRNGLQVGHSSTLFQAARLLVAATAILASMYCDICHGLSMLSRYLFVGNMDPRINLLAFHLAGKKVLKITQRALAIKPADHAFDVSLISKSLESQGGHCL